MSAKRSKSGRISQRKREMGARLNDVCRLVGAPNLKAFHAQLAEDAGDEFPSYAAALTYHTPPFRDPPTIYLERIGARFPAINLTWLVAGRGEALPRQGNADSYRAGWKAIEEELGPNALVAGVHWMRLMMFASHYIDTGNDVEPPEAMAVVLRRIATALRAPLDSLGIDHRDVTQQLDTYLALVGAALEVVFRNTENAAPNDGEVMP